MLGFLIGTACLIGLVRVLRGGRRRWGYGYGGHHWNAFGGHHGCGHGGYGREAYGAYDDAMPPRRGGWGRHGGWGRNFFLRGIFERLDTSPGQEKAIRAALDELRAQARGMKDDVRETRSEVARAMRGDVLDDDALGTIRARTSAAAEAMQSAVGSALAKIHDALDERQRNLLADFIDEGPRGFGRWGRGGPYRGSPVV